MMSGFCLDGWNLSAVGVYVFSVLSRRYQRSSRFDRCRLALCRLRNVLEVADYDFCTSVAARLGSRSVVVGAGVACTKDNFACHLAASAGTVRTSVLHSEADPAVAVDIVAGAVVESNLGVGVEVEERKASTRAVACCIPAALNAYTLVIVALIVLLVGDCMDVVVVAREDLVGEGGFGVRLGYQNSILLLPS
jgi:hypothetical protein